MLDNIQLENYQEIKYYKQEQILFCEMKSIEDGKEVCYIYEFGMDNKLQKATIFFDSGSMEIFNRFKSWNKHLKIMKREVQKQLDTDLFRTRVGHYYKIIVAH